MGFLVTYRYDFQVDSTTLRLPTLKELVGLTTFLSNIHSTTEISLSPETNRIVDTTNEFQDGVYKKNQLDNREILLDGIEKTSNSNDTFFESKNEKEIFDNDILGSEEIQRRSSSTSFVDLDGSRVNQRSDDEKDTSNVQKSVKRVEVPVKILDDGNGEEIAELVLLRVPESKLNSAILKPVFRVKIVEHNVAEDRKSVESSKKLVKIENSSESSLENELPDNIRLTSGGKSKSGSSSSQNIEEQSVNNSSTLQTPPRTRQRIIKARRRSRPNISKESKAQVSDVQDNESRDFKLQGARRLSRRRENSRNSSLDSTTLPAESLENFSTIRPTTIRGNYSNLFKVSNVTRGFYVTKNIEETSTISDSTTTDFTESTVYPSASKNEIFDDSTREMDVTTENGDFTTENTEPSTTTRVEFTTQLDEMTPPKGSLIHDTTTFMGPEIPIEITTRSDFNKDEEFASNKYETATQDSISTLKDPPTEFSVSMVTTTYENPTNEPDITTFRPWIIRQLTTMIPTTSIESTTMEFSSDRSTEIGDNYTTRKVEETTENSSETLKTSENGNWRSPIILETASTILPEITVSAQDEETTRLRTEKNDNEMDNENQSTKLLDKENSAETIFETQRSLKTSTTVSTIGTLGGKDESIASQTERSMRRTTEQLEKATTYRSVSSRGGARYTVSPKSSSSVESSRKNRGPSRGTTKKTSVENEGSHPESGSLSFVERANPENGTKSSSPHVRSSSRGRNTARKTTKAFPNDKTGSLAFDSAKSSTSPASTESYDKILKSTLESAHSLTGTEKDKVTDVRNSKLSSRSRNNYSKTTKSLETEKTGSNTRDQEEPIAKTTEAYEEISKSTTIGEDTYLTTNLEEETASRFEILQTSSTTPETILNTTESLEIDETESSTWDYHLASTTTFDFEKNTGVSYSSAENELPSITPSINLDDRTVHRTTPTSPASYSTTNDFELMKSTTLTLEEVDSTPETTESTSEKTIDHESSIVPTIYPTTNSIEKNDNSFYTTTIIAETVPFLTTTEADEKWTETINPVNTFVTDDITESKENETTSPEMYETTAGYGKTTIPWLSMQRNDVIENRKNEFPFISNDTMREIKLESFESTTASYPNTDPAEFLTNDDQDYTKMNYHTTPDFSEEFVGEITNSNNNNIENNVTTESGKISTTTLASTIYDRSIDTTISTGSTATKMHTAAKEFNSTNDYLLSRETSSTTPIYEKNTQSKMESSTIFQTPVTERQMKRTRGRVRFTNFAVDSKDENDNSNRRPIKQVVVRRRLAKDRHRNSTTPERNLIETLANSSNENNENVSRDEVKHSRIRNKNVKKNKTSSTETPPNEDEISKDKNTENSNNSVNNLASRLPEENINAPRSTRRRVVVYRGRPRSEKIATTPSTTTTTTTTQTTTVQSFSIPGNDVSEEGAKKKRKWRKRIVRKRSRSNTEEDDQSIAETGDFRRTLIDDEIVDDFRDDPINSYVILPEENLKSSEQEDINGEVNVFKNSGAFLRRPGTLIRTEALNRPRSKTPSNSISTAPNSTKNVPFTKIQSVDPSYEIKTDDQSVRAQEYAVTLADPPEVGTSTTGRVGLRKGGTTRKISTTIAPRTEASRTTPIVRRRQNRPRNDNLRIIETPPARPRRPAIIDYDYYVDDEIRIVLKPELNDKLFVTRKGGIRCLDQGNFAHPTSCKKFITCARMVNGQVIGTEYTCPDKLSFDPVGGICNWSAGLGCEEKSKSKSN